MAESNRHPDVASELLRLGFKLISDSAYTFGFERRPGEIVYVKKTTKRSVVLDPRYFSDGEVIEGVAGYAYWNSNLHTFDKAPRREIARTLRDRLRYPHAWPRRLPR
jgi:hypothetical protein